VTSDKKKIFKHDDKQYDRLSEHIGLLPLIMITPHDITLVNGSGEERRRFFDTYICQVDKQYLVDIASYSKLLAERNKCLKTNGQQLDRDLLSVLDERMDSFGRRIHATRAAICKDLEPIAQQFYHSIAPGEEISITYESQLHDARLLALLERTFERDRVLGFTSAGIHRDDFTFSMNGKPIRNFGSQGQKKSFLMSLKFGQYQHMSSLMTVKPILILDDLFDKLDKTRVSRVVDIIGGNDFGQIFISDTDRSNLTEVFSRADARIIQL
jgi:DNA replication and repair protein RecF